MQKLEFLNLEPKMPCLRVLDSNFKKPLSYLQSALSNLCNCKSLQKKKKSLNLEPQIPYLGIFELEFENDIVIFEISTLELV